MNVQLVTLPGLNLDCPDINMPALKGFLEEHQIKSHLTDLNIMAFYTKMKRHSLIKMLRNIPNAINRVDLILHAISIINGTIHSSYEEYQIAGEIIKNAMITCAKPYQLLWNNKGIQYETIINSKNIIEESLNSHVYSFFDDVFDEYVNSITSDDYFIVLSVTNSSQYPLAIRLAKRIKDKGNVHIIITGNYLPYISELLPAITDKAQWIDAHIIGHIEDVILDLVKTEDYQETSIIETKAWKNPEKVASQHLSCVPDFSDLELSIYLSKELVLPFQITNGCYYGQCKFCSFHYGDGNYYCLSNTLAETYIDTYIKKYQVKYLLFVDKCIPPSTVLHMCRYIIDKSYSINWLLETRIDPLYSIDENISLLKEAGCKVISFGIESADQKMLNQMNKGIDFSFAEQCMRKISHKGICVASTIMLQFLGENTQSLQRTLSFLLSNDYIDLFGILFYSITKHSPIYEDNIHTLKLSLDEVNDMSQLFDRNLLIKKADIIQTDLINQFFSNSIVKHHMQCLSKTLYRSHYLFWPKDKYSFQYRKLHS